MISKASAKYLRVSPQKARLVISLIKGKSVDEAVGILRNTNKKSAKLISKLLKSAMANAKRFPHIQQEDLYISNIHADAGPMLKRFKAHTMGRAGSILKRTAHIALELEAKQAQLPKKAVAKPAPAAKPAYAKKAVARKTPGLKKSKGKNTDATKKE